VDLRYKGYLISRICKEDKEDKEGKEGSQKK